MKHRNTIWKFVFERVTKLFGLFLIVFTACALFAQEKDKPLVQWSSPALQTRGQENAVIRWNNAALQAIRYRRPWPTIGSRALAISHTCMYDAWAAYDDKAVATRLGARLRRPPEERSEQNKTTAISFAAYRCLSDLFPNDVANFDAVMKGLGFNPGDESRDPATPTGIGNLVAESVLEFRHHDGSNQLGDLHPGAYSDYTDYRPVNEYDHLNNVDRWQPLRTPIPDGGLYGRYLIQTFVTPQWARVTPFAMKTASEFRPKPPASYTRSKEPYVRQAQELLELSADLTDDQKMMVEYWADGPNSETPPGHWCLFAQYVSTRDHHTACYPASMRVVDDRHDHAQCSAHRRNHVTDPVHQVQERALGLCRRLALHSFVSRRRAAKVLRLEQHWRQLNKNYEKQEQRRDSRGRRFGLPKLHTALSSEPLFVSLAERT